LLLPFGVDTDAYRNVDVAPAASDVALMGPTAGFVGHINERIDLGVLEAIADRGRSLLLVGPRNPSFEPDRFDSLIDRPNVQWVGPKPFPALPSYLRAIHVGLVPYGDSPFNRGSFPLKTLEYLAAGRPVISTDLPASRWLATDLVTVTAGPEQFADSVDQALAAPASAACRQGCRAFAANHDWTHRAEALLQAVRLTSSGDSSSASNARPAPL
jgi:teichuronic acid biosynthesis glycosyltransferase TuaH